MFDGSIGTTRRARRGMLREWRLHALSVFSLAVAFVCLGAALLVLTNLRSIEDRWAHAGRASIYLKDNAAAQDVESLKTALGGVPTSIAVALEDVEEALAEYGRLVAKPVRDGSSYGVIFVNAKQDLVAVRSAAKTEEYLIEPFVAGVEATCAVLEQTDGTVIALPPIEIIAAEGVFDYTAKYLLQSTREICPGRFTPDVAAQLKDNAMKAHRALSCRGYTRSDFIVSARGVVYLETNTLPGLTKASLLPKALEAQGIAFVDFLNDQIELAVRHVRR